MLSFSTLAYSDIYSLYFASTVSGDSPERAAWKYSVFKFSNDTFLSSANLIAILYHSYKYYLLLICCSSSSGVSSSLSASSNSKSFSISASNFVTIASKDSIRSTSDDSSVSTSSLPSSSGVSTIFSTLAGTLLNILNSPLLAHAAIFLEVITSSISPNSFASSALSQVSASSSAFNSLRSNLSERSK